MEAKGSTERTRRDRKRLLALYGDRCAVCAHSDIRVLELDHIHGGGTKERKIRHHQKLFRALVAGTEDRTKFRLLCANCHKLHGRR